MAIPHRLHHKEAQAEIASAKRVDPAVTSSPDLPTDADTAADHIISQYNLGRRWAGEAPLDLKGMERLHRLILEEVDRLLAGTKPGDVH